MQPLDQNFFNYLLELEVRKATRYLYYFSVLVVQIDNGRPEPEGGEDEAVHVTMSYLLRDEIRGTDVLGKRLDNSFFIILHYTDLEHAVKVAQRIRERVQHYTFQGQTGDNHRTVSVGLSCFPTNANDVNGLVQKSEEQLIKARGKGGNAVCLPE
jgi:diguanylate cyclase (GGDEF)-like protein